MADSIRSAEELVKRALVEPGMLEKIKADPGPTLQQLATSVVRDVPPRPPLQADPIVYRLAVGVLGVVAISAVIGAIILAFQNAKVPDLLTAIGSASIGALAGLLAPSPGSRQ